VAALEWLGRDRLLVACVGEPGTGAQAKAVRLSSDGGHTWHTHVSVAFAARRAVRGLSGFGYLSGAAVLPDRFGLLWEARGGVLRTDDGGRRWQGLDVAGPAADQALAACVLPPDAAYLVLYDSMTGGEALLHSVDRGRTWQSVVRWSLN
jgi:photosystem II stability/assembly factor-like uncharacterized protein